MYYKKYHIESSEVDQNLDLKLSSLMRMMQDVATDHAETIGFGKKNTIDKGMYWVITRYALTVLKYPKFLDDITIYTYPGDDMRFIFPRYFLVYNQNNELLIKASSSWMILDRNTRKVVLKPFEGIVIPSEHHVDEEPLPRKVIPSPTSFIESRKVRYSDIDLNGHLNNTKYIEYILDSKTTEFYKHNKIKHILISYEKELLDGETIELYSNNSNPEYMVGTANNNVIFEINIEYEEMK